MEITAAPNIKPFLKITSPKDVLIPKLEAVLVAAQDAYYNTNKELLSDSDYDRLEEILKTVKPKSSALRTRAPVNKKVKVRLPFKMSSLNKINPAQFNVTKWLDGHPGPFVLSDKLDGSSLMLYYDVDGVSHLYTGGDGITGGDISFLLPYIKGLPTKKFKNVALRGEALISRGAFKKYAVLFKNPRAMANGLVNREKIQEHVKDLDIVFYRILSPSVTVLKGFQWLKSNGFNTAPFKEFPTITEGKLRKVLERRKAVSKYDLDGIVLSQNVREVATLENPDHSVAFKEMQASDITSAVVTGIDWEASSQGYLIPTVLVEPTELFGTTVRRASGHNANNVITNRIDVGAVVELTKGGEVIPKILRVLKPSKKTSEQIMPEGFGDYAWDKQHTHLVLTDADSHDTVALKRIVRFFATMKVDGLKGASVKSLIDSGHDSILKIVKVDRDQMVDILGKNGKIIWDSIQEKLSSASIPRLLDASGAFPRGIGERRIASIEKAYPDFFSDWKPLSEKTVAGMVSRIDGFDTTTANAFASGLQKFYPWYLKFPKNLITLVKPVSVKKTGSAMSGQRVLFTGFRSKDLEDWILSNDGSIASSAKTCTILLTKDLNSNSSKMIQAQSNGAKILTPSQFMTKYNVT